MLSIIFRSDLQMKGASTHPIPSYPIPFHLYSQPQGDTVTPKPFALAEHAVMASTKNRGVLVPLTLCLNKETRSYLQRAVAHSSSYCSATYIPRQPWDLLPLQPEAAQPSV